MPAAAAVVGGTTAAGMFAADKAAKVQANAANRASDVQWNMYNQTRQDNMPWMQAGQGGLNGLMQLYGFQNNNGQWERSANPMAAAQSMLQSDPSYQFRLQQGQGAVENSALARGGLLSGNALKAMQDYGQNMASTEYGNIANRLAGLSGMGQGSAQYMGGMGANTAANVGNNMMNAGAARASGYTGMYNALSNGVNQGMSLFGMGK